MNWHQQVKIFADKNIKASNKSETSGTISYSVVLVQLVLHADACLDLIAYWNITGSGDCDSDSFGWKMGEKLSK